MKNYLAIVLIFSTVFSFAQHQEWEGKFEDISNLLPTPNEYRTGSGSPGPQYWQQQADYVIDVELNDTNQTVTGKETITYHNNSGEPLTFLWLQLDQNILSEDNLTSKTKTNNIQNKTSAKSVADELNLNNPSGGYNIKSVTQDGKPLSFSINHTMMRVDLPEPLISGKNFSFSLEWSFKVGERMLDKQRSGMEYFPEDGNFLYTIAQFFPRMCVFDDYEGWQNKQYLGRGEFALPFGNYNVSITVPADHLVAATGSLMNAKDVFSPKTLERFEKAKSSFDKPIIIVSEDEAIAKEKTKSKEKKTWKFSAENVRDFAFASSRKFIWDAMAVKIGDKTPLAMSFYPKEGNPLWELESTNAIKNTLITYSKYTFDYPYPVAISVHTADLGMEYPMICFNWGRPVDGVYNDALKYKTIGVIIHEAGHNFFPMIVNSDERQWAWMDEALNVFLEYRTEQECYENFPSRRVPPKLLVPYVKGDKSSYRPIMTNPEQVIKLTGEQYVKAGTALNILRETVMGPELFDMAFKEYAQRWAFKHPKPADFFRTMEDASAVDLDWFWRGWFYTTDNVDIAVENIKWYRLSNDKAVLENRNKKVKDNLNHQHSLPGPEPFHIFSTDERFLGEFRNSVNDRSIIGKLENKNIYEITFSNVGGLVMPLIIEWSYADGSREVERIPAEIWRTNEKEITKVFVKEKEITGVTLDPYEETADVNPANNTFPRSEKKSRFDTFKENEN